MQVKLRENPELNPHQSREKGKERNVDILLLVLARSCSSCDGANLYVKEHETHIRRELPSKSTRVSAVRRSAPASEFPS